MSVSGGGPSPRPVLISSSSIKSNVDAQQQWLKAHSIEENILNVKFAGEQARDRLYESKEKKKLVRVLTVIGYIITVSLAAIMLSLYYVFFYPKHQKAKADRLVSLGTSLPKVNPNQAVYPFYDLTTEMYEPIVPSPRHTGLLQKIIMSTYQTNINDTY